LPQRTGVAGSVWVTVADANSPPELSTSIVRIVAEGTQPGSFVGAPLIAADNDAPGTSFSRHTWQIIGGDVSQFVIDSTSGQIRAAPTATPFDFETQSSYTIRVRVTDGGGLSDVGQVAIYVDNANEAPVFFALSNRTIREDAAPGSVLGAPLSATDPDGGDSSLAYSLVGGTGASVFAVDLCTGEITLRAAPSVPGVAPTSLLDFESRKFYTLEVQATDGGSPPASTNALIWVFVTDANDPPVILPQTRRVVENARTGTLVGTPLFWSDPDASGAGPSSWSTVTFAIISGNSAGTFAVFCSSWDVCVVVLVCVRLF
jgi:hypothetical protein